jgi:hypothetical protein
MMSIDFAPMFPWPLIAGLAALGVLALGYGLFRRARGLAWRTVAIAALAAALANPVLVEEERQPLSDIATVVSDDSPSQAIAGRPAQSAAALADLKAKLDAMQGLETRYVQGGAGRDGAAQDGTRVFESLGRALSGVPRSRMGATILITDGQVHDVPEPGAALPFAGPLHVLLTGRRNERDRMLTVEDVPGFGLVGKEVTLRIRVDDTQGRGGTARVTVVQDGKPVGTVSAPIGEPHSIPIKVEHAGANIVQLEVEPAERELTTANNRGVVQINGVRERLRVLLVSGEPHAGERVWRNFLKADPSVDLVHFTILRPPEKQDATPVRELSLIAFPIRELFEVKLNEFDLIIFDRYKRRGILPNLYLENVARYVERGGAVLDAAGPTFATPLGLSNSPLGSILPAEPTGRVFEQGLKPVLSKTGDRHPVTADLVSGGETGPQWGRWFRQVDVNARRGATLMSGVDSKPLLVVDRIGDGRVAQLLSDHVWLWARGFELGGPHSELLRRLAHWLMKEPDLEEDDLRAFVEDKKLAIVRRSLEPDATPVQVTAPSGATETVTLKDGVAGRARGQVAINEIGIYRVSDGKRTALAAVGNLNPREYADMRATADRLEKLAAATGGGIHWIEDGMPELRRVREGRLASGRGWFGILANRDYRVASVRQIPMLPGYVMLLLGLGALVLAWRREGR